MMKFGPLKALKWAAIGSVLSSQPARRAIVAVFIVIFGFILLRGCMGAVSSVNDAIEKEVVTQEVVTAQVTEAYEAPTPRIPPKRTPKARKAKGKSAKGDLEFKAAVSYTLKTLEDNTKNKLKGDLPSEVVEKINLNNPLVAEALDEHIRGYLIYLARVAEVDWRAIDTLDKSEGNEHLIIKLPK